MGALSEPESGADVIVL